ncbi:MmgE/PrpD family protein [Actinomadura sp.]|jgi:2-methylcitrate dehydratase PrpD|uniref:MmgE/PrpD family protein n=1 Tax=Actinomadura sp. TaxID=1989 RepID=UPI0037C73071
MIVKDFAAFAVASRGGPLPDEVYDAATRALVDWYSATLAGSGMPPAEILRRALGDSPGSARLIPDGRPADPRAAALINGTASHTAELDDIFRDGIYHPGSPTVAAALAAAQRIGASGERLLRAIAVGYEIGDRIAAAMQPAHYAYWHTTGTVGTLGAAAAVAELLELDTERFAHAVATAATNAAGLQQAFRSDAMSKPLHAGHAAEAGLVAAFAAAEGFTGALDILEGPVGLGAAMSDAPDWESAVGRLGRPWAVTQATVKNHSCCGHTFAVVDAGLELRAGGLDVQAISSVDVETYTTATKVAGYTDPQSAFEAKFSIVYCLAAALRLGTVRLAAFTPESLADPELRALMSRVTVRASDEFEKDFPGKRRARVTVHLADGTSVTRARDTRKGDPDDPLTDAELRDKFDDLAVPVIGEEAARSLGDALWAARSAADVRDAFGPHETAGAR